MNRSEFQNFDPHAEDISILAGERATTVDAFSGDRDADRYDRAERQQQENRVRLAQGAFTNLEVPERPVSVDDPDAPKRDRIRLRTPL